VERARRRGARTRPSGSQAALPIQQAYRPTVSWKLARQGDGAPAARQWGEGRRGDSAAVLAWDKTHHVPTALAASARHG
jgi:hypothetical protein